MSSRERIEIDEDRIREEMKVFSEVVSSEEFIEQLRAVAETDEDERLSEAAERLSPRALREAGVDLPEGVRISSRYFEGTDVPALELGDLRDRPNIVTELHETNPGILDDLRSRNPRSIDELIKLTEDAYGVPEQDFLTICASVGTPYVPVCVTVGEKV